MEYRKNKILSRIEAYRAKALAVYFKGLIAARVFFIVHRLQY